MSASDRAYWDRRWVEDGVAPSSDHAPAPPVFDDLVELLPTGGRALDVACGPGRGSVWMAQRGLDVFAVDVSAVAVDFARQHADAMGVGGRCKFAVVDLNDGLPAGPPVELVVSYLYWTPELTRPLVERLAPGGLLAVCHVSEADVGPGEWRIPVGSLRKAFAAIDQLDIIDDRGTDGMAASSPVVDARQVDTERAPRRDTGQLPIQPLVARL